MLGCSKCYKLGGIAFLVLGILYLIADLTAWDFLGIQWYTALFIVVGLGHLGSAGCKDCKAVREGRK